MKFDPTKPVQTRDGREAIIFGEFPNLDNQPRLFGICKVNDGFHSMKWCTDGRKYPLGNETPDDLVNTPVHHEAWVNIYADKWGGYEAEGTFATRALADSSRCGDDCVACIQINWTDGEGLE